MLIVTFFDIYSNTGLCLWSCEWLHSNLWSKSHLHVRLYHQRTWKFIVCTKFNVHSHFVFFSNIIITVWYSINDRYRIYLHLLHDMDDIWHPSTNLHSSKSDLIVPHLHRWSLIVITPLQSNFHDWFPVQIILHRNENHHRNKLLFAIQIVLLWPTVW